jgi:hypothetical protein
MDWVDRGRPGSDVSGGAGGGRGGGPGGAAEARGAGREVRSPGGMVKRGTVAKPGRSCSATAEVRATDTR